MAGDMGSDNNLYSMAWAAKVDRSGNMLWNRYYVNDSLHDAYFRDVAVTPSGGFAFVGANYNDTLPTWHTMQDVWLVVTDSYGCEVGGCDAPAAVPAAPQPVVKNSEVLAYPNPTNETLNIKTPKGIYTNYTITNTLGQVLMQNELTNTQTTVNVKTLTSGLYYITLRGASGSTVQKFVKM